jgi:antitoxin PrlF
MGLRLAAYDKPDSYVGLSLAAAKPAVIRAGAILTAGEQLGGRMDVPATLRSKGQLTLPKSVRDALVLKEGDRVLFRVLKGRAVIAKVEDFLDLAGSVRVSPEKKGAAWPAIKASTWRRRAMARK